MTSPYPFGEPIIVVTETKTGVDVYGNAVTTESTVTVYGALDEGLSAEIIDGRDLVTTQPTVYLPAGTVVQATDKIIARGVTYLVDGSPNSPANPYTGWAPGVVVKLKGWSG